MLRARVVPGIVIAVLALFCAPLAHAVDMTTRWYSIGVQPATDASPHLFLSNGSEGVTLERYRSGDPSQMWTPVQPDYPRTPDIEGGSGLDLLECFLEWRCPFEGHGGALVRFVNRTSGGCLTVGAEGAYSTPCANGGGIAEQQKWQLNDRPDAQRGFYSPMMLSGEATCLSATAKDGEAVAGGVLQSQGCGDHWSQKFTMLVSAEITCRPPSYVKLCFVEGQN